MYAYFCQEVSLVLRIMVPAAHLSGLFSDHHLRPACTDAYDCPSMYVPLNTAGIPSHESPLVVFQGPRRLVAILDECVLRYMKVAGHARGMILQSMECIRDHADARLRWPYLTNDHANYAVPYKSFFCHTLFLVCGTGSSFVTK